MGASGVVIVGGGLAAVRVAEQLRAAGEGRSITIVSAESYPPYDRPPLSKEFLVDSTRGPGDVALKPAEFYAEKTITLQTGTPARSLDTAAQKLTLDDGSVLGYDELIIATGLIPRRIASLPDLPGIHVLRSLDDASALRRHSAAARHAVIIGAGFIGCEVAACENSSIRLRCRFPLSCRPGPPLGSDGSASSSNRTAVIAAASWVPAMDWEPVGREARTRMW